MAGYLGQKPAVNGIYTVDEFTSSGGTTYTLSRAPGSKNNIQVNAGGLAQYPSAYSVSGTTLTLSGVPSGQKVVVRHMGETILYPALDDGIVTNAKLADDAVGLAEMAPGTDGNIITYDASGNPAAVATGTAGQVLTSAGAGAPPTFAAAAAGGSWTLIGTAVASNSASLTVTGIDSTYDLYAIGLSDLHPVDDTPALYGRVGDSGGIDTGGTDYAFHLQMVRQNAAGYDATWDTSEGKFKFANEVGNSTGEGVSGLCWLARPADGVTQPMITGTMAWINGSTILYQGSLGATRMAVIAIDRIQCFFSSGNIESGRMTIWGVKHT